MQNIYKVKIIFILLLPLLLFSCNKPNFSFEKKAKDDKKNTITIFVDNDIDEGSKQWLNLLQQEFSEANLVIKTNIVNNEKYFLEKFLQGEFDADIIISKYLSNNNSQYLANLAGKSFFPDSFYNTLKKMDKDGNIYLIPFTNTKKYLLINKNYFDSFNIELPNNGFDVLKSFSKINDLKKAIYFNNNYNSSVESEIFSYAFSLTDGLTIKGFKWANDLEAGVANVGDLDLTSTFDFMDYFKNLPLDLSEDSKKDLNTAINELEKNQVGIFEVNTNDISKIQNIYSTDYYVLPFYSPLDNKNYILTQNQSYIAVNKNSMENKKQLINDFLYKILGSEGNKIIINDNNSLYSPIFNLSSSIYDTSYINDIYENKNENKLATFYIFNRGKEYLSSAVEQYLNNQISREEFINYWQQDVLVSKFNLNKVNLADINDALYPKDCSMIIAKAIYAQYDCDVSIMTVSNLIDQFDNIRSMYSGSPYFMEKGKIYWEDITNIVPPNVNNQIDTKSQKVITYNISGAQLVDFLNNQIDSLVYCGIKKINNAYYLIDNNGKIESINPNKNYRIATNSNFYLPNYSLPNYQISDINLVDLLMRWILDNSPISYNSIYTFNIVAD